jgi:hypothetical protein
MAGIQDTYAYNRRDQKHVDPHKCKKDLETQKITLKPLEVPAPEPPPAARLRRLRSAREREGENQHTRARRGSIAASSFVNLESGSSKTTPLPLGLVGRGLAPSHSSSSGSRAPRRRCRGEESDPLASYQANPSRSRRPLVLYRRGRPEPAPVQSPELHNSAGACAAATAKQENKIPRRERHRRRVVLDRKSEQPDQPPTTKQSATPVMDLEPIYLRPPPLPPETKQR